MSVRKPNPYRLRKMSAPALQARDESQRVLAKRYEKATERLLALGEAEIRRLKAEASTLEATEELVRQQTRFRHLQRLRRQRD